MTSPVIGSAWTNAIMFAVYERTLKMIDDNPQNPTLKSVFYAGAVGGFWQTVPLAPAELIKCRLQVQDGRRSSQYRGPMDCIRHIFKVKGTPGLFLGFTCTLWREVPSFAVYFWLYEYTKRNMIDGGFNATTSMLTAGGVAGVASWVVSYPMDGTFICWFSLQLTPDFCAVQWVGIVPNDVHFGCVKPVIKSAIQTLPVNHKPGEHKMAYQARLLYRLGGWRIFFSGLGTACVRAFPCNAVTFYGYEKSSEWLKKIIED
ncbi:unnamed protein product [Phytophthora lilii]|uniref:Unnamed protein product n=1 Tax=Phytophthora lilii TaxID=2077276 RepID=A0A9W6TAC2_9STRA|nr:unnamed protein product [Phytophthora lilii]